MSHCSPWYSGGGSAPVLCGVSGIFREQTLASDVEDSTALGAVVFRKKCLPVWVRESFCTPKESVRNALASSEDLCKGIKHISIKHL